MFPTFDTEEITLREITIHDTDDMFRYYCDPDMMRFTSTNVHASQDETIARITKLSQSFINGKGIAWAIENKSEKKVVGDIGLYYISSDCKKAGVGFNVAREYWNRGYGTCALTLALRYAINTLSLNRIEATCKTDNIASARVMEKSGMHFEGILRQYSCKNGNYHDVKMYSMIKGDIKD
jgi:ribosomal-protein-alanine N-acetyltransferase